MRFFDLVSLIFFNLGRRKGRVALTAVGVVIGTAAVIVLVSFGIGLQENATSQLGNIGDLTRIDVMPGFNVMYDSAGGGGKPPQGGDGTVQMLTPDAIAQITAIPGVKSVLPRDYMMGGFTLKFGRLEGWAQIMAVEGNNLEPFGYTLASGTMTLAKGKVVIGGYIPKNFYDPRWRPGQPEVVAPEMQDGVLTLVMIKYATDGQEIRKTVRLEVVGVLVEEQAEQDGSIYVSMEELKSWNEWSQGRKIKRDKEGYSNLVVKAESADDVIDITQAITDMGFQAYNNQQYVKGITGFFTVMQIVFGGVGAIALLVAAIGIANTMTMAILERTREIGLIKAVGGTNRNVLSIFLGEAAGIGFLGGLGGVIIGWGGGQILNSIAVAYLADQAIQQGGLPPTVAVLTPVWLPIFALIFATLVGLISGLYPALRAATLVPVTALKYE
jgi:putative ABC transport system permease protein